MHFDASVLPRNSVPTLSAFSITCCKHQSAQHTDTQTHTHTYTYIHTHTHNGAAAGVLAARQIDSRCTQQISESKLHSFHTLARAHQSSAVQHSTMHGNAKQLGGPHLRECCQPSDGDVVVLPQPHEVLGHVLERQLQSAISAWGSTCTCTCTCVFCLFVMCGTEQ